MRRLPTPTGAALLLLALLLLPLLGGCREARPGARRSSVDAPAGGFLWAGALAPRSVRITASFARPDSAARFVVAAEGDTLRSAPLGVPEGGGVLSAVVRGLTPGTGYRYGVETAARPAALRGAFTTPEDGPFPFRVAMSGCARTGSSSRVFDAIRRADPLFFLHLGDFHYEDLTATEPAFYRRAWRAALAAPAQSRLYRSAPVAYVWDDHDFGPNNANRLAPGRTAARAAYQEVVPHYPLALGEGDVPIAQAFTVGRVRFVLTDLRSERDPQGLGAMAERTMLGERQKEWLKAEFLRARGAGLVTAWVSTVPWIAPALDGADHWGGYAAEREELARFMAENGIDNVAILSGDAHMVAFDDGSNSGFAPGADSGPPVVQAASLDQFGSVKGGPYSEGPFPADLVPPFDGQWVQMDVEDDGGPEVCLGWTGYRTDWTTGRTTPLATLRRCFAVPEPRPDALQITAVP